MEKIKFAMLKKMAIESTLQSSMLKEILTKVSGEDGNLKAVQMEYHKRFEAAMGELKKWTLVSAGLNDSIDWTSLFGYDPLKDS